MDSSGLLLPFFLALAIQYAWLFGLDLLDRCPCCSVFATRRIVKAGPLITMGLGYGHRRGISGEGVPSSKGIKVKDALLGVPAPLWVLVMFIVV